VIYTNPPKTVKTRFHVFWGYPDLGQAWPGAGQGVTPGLVCIGLIYRRTGGSPVPPGLRGPDGPKTRFSGFHAFRGFASRSPIGTGKPPFWGLGVPGGPPGRVGGAPQIRTECPHSPPPGYAKSRVLGPSGARGS